jgi:putative transposase
MGCVRIAGELRKLAIRVGATIRTLLRRNALGPAPRRSGPTWTQLLRAQAEAIVACDFFTVETIRLQTLYVLFFIQVSTRRVLVAGVTANPSSAWVTQQARNVAMDLDDPVSQSGSYSATMTPSSLANSTRCSTPKARRSSEPRSRLPGRTGMPSGGSRRCAGNVWTGRWGSGGGICNGSSVPTCGIHQQRPHRGLALAVPQPQEPSTRLLSPPAIRRRDVLGGLIHEYHAVSA